MKCYEIFKKQQTVKILCLSFCNDNSTYFRHTHLLKNKTFAFFSYHIFRTIFILFPLLGRHNKSLTY